MRIEERRDGRAIPYYWMMFQRAGFTPGDGTDLEALAANKVSVTPLRTRSDRRGDGCATPRPSRRLERGRDDAMGEALIDGERRGTRAIHAAHARARGRRPPAAARARARAALAVHAAALRRHRRARHRAADRLRPDRAAALDRRCDDRGAGRAARRAACWRSARGTGYATALLAQMAGEILSLERCQTLAVEAAERLAAFGVDNVEVAFADGLAYRRRCGARSTASSFTA